MRSRADKAQIKVSMDGVERCEKWMLDRGWQPAPFQIAAWQAHGRRQQGIINAPTGSGKTYSILLPFLLGLAHDQKHLGMIWITPIRALAKEIHQSALRVIESMGLDVEVAIRTGDTLQKEKEASYIRPPHVLITTPESLHLLLGRKKSSAYFRHLDTIVWTNGMS